MSRPPLPAGNIPASLLCQILGQPQGHNAAGRGMSMKILKTTSGIKPTNIWLVAIRNKSAILYLSPIKYSPINHTFYIKQCDLLAVSFIKNTNKQIIMYICIALSSCIIQGGSNMTGTDLYVNKPHCAAAVRP